MELKKHLDRRHKLEDKKKEEAPVNKMSSLKKAEVFESQKKTTSKITDA